MTYTAEERKFWTDVYRALLTGSGQLMSSQSYLGDCEMYCDDALVAYRQRFGNCSETPNSSPVKPDFAGAPEPITDDVLRSLGFERLDYGPWRISGDAQCAVMFVCANSARVTTDLTDARKLRAIMEILRA